MKQFLRIIFLFAILIFSASSVFAEGSVDYSVEISQKFCRGLKNVLSSPLEIPCAIRDDVKNRGAAGSITGVFRGIVLMARRILVGVTEVGTFVIPMKATIPPVCAERPQANIQQ